MKTRLFLSTMVVLSFCLHSFANLVTNPGFESMENIGNGLPNSYGDWSGDDGTIVAAENGINPLEGDRMLRFDATSPGGAYGGSTEGAVLQLIDISSYKDLISTGDAFVSGTAYFNRVAGDAQTDTFLGIFIYAYEGDVSTFKSQFLNGQYLKRVTENFSSDSDINTWEEFSLQLNLPENTGFLMLGIRAHEDIYDDSVYPEFDGHFADAVSLTIGSLSPLERLEIVGPSEVAEDFQAQYKAIAHYENGFTADVTNAAVWLVEPNDNASISAGLLETEMIDLPEDITIYAQYTEGDITVGAEKTVSVLAICPSGYALKFDGVDDYVSLAECTFTTTEFTIAAWANHLGMAGGIEKTNQIFNQRDDLTGDNKSAVTLLTEYAGYDPTAATTTIRSSDGTAQTLSFPKKEYGQWHHYACTLSLDYFIFYIDGIEVDRVENLQEGDYNISIDYVDIGRRRFNGITRSFYNGLIDDVQIYNRALSAEEIQELMYIRPNIDDPNLVGYWDFDEGEGQILYDMSSNGNDGQLGTSPTEDNSDPAWVDSDAPIGICTLEELVEQNITGVLDIKLDVLEQLENALTKERMLLRFLNTSFKDRDFGTASKADVVKAKQKILSAVQHEQQAETSMGLSIEKIDDALKTLGIELEDDSE